MDDEEILAIASDGTYTDCASLDTSENKNRIEECYEYVGMRQDDPDACAAATGYYRDSCYEDVAVDLNDETLCNEIDDKNDKGDCYTDIAVNKADPSLCENLDGGRANECYKEYAEDTGDFDACALIPEKDDESDECYLHFAVQDNNRELCEDLNEKKYRDECRSELAVMNQDQTLCEEIEKKKVREECLENVESLTPEPGKCQYDSECDSICEGEIKWAMGCNPREGVCEKTFDYDCREEIENFAGTEFPMTCAAGECVRNQAAIDATKAELEALQDEISQNVKNINAYRQEVNTLKLDANKKCLNALADVTNKFIIENAVKLGSIASAGAGYLKSGSSIVSSTTSIKYSGGKFTTVTKPSYEFTKQFGTDAAGYFGDWTDKLVDTMSKLNSAPADAKPPVDQYIAFWCDYNNYLGEILDATAMELDHELAVAQAIEEEINALP